VVGFVKNRSFDVAELNTSTREHRITRDDAFWLYEALTYYRFMCVHPMEDPLIRRRIDKLVEIFDFDAIED